MAQDWGYDEINFNVGCPSPRVCSGNFGASLMKDPEKAAKCIESLKNKSQKNLLNGGPVDIDKLFIIHDSDDKESLCVKNGLNLTSSMNVVKNIASGKFKGKYKLAIGYCGWDSGQLDEEIANNSWFVIEHKPNFVFELNVDEIIPYLSKELGYDLRQILNSKDTTKH